MDRLWTDMPHHMQTAHLPCTNMHCAHVDGENKQYTQMRTRLHAYRRSYRKGVKRRGRGRAQGLMRVRKEGGHSF